ncbi:helix-turn-helix domain-containing protein [Streptomyces sp. NBC_00984]|uniref:helix-turn-helix transcriptional regulator n=1 Tax=Streptomyces sp. NBC_00984 TaxID=2903700 RepID=UPI003865781D|nr:helix-turn-helix domain-containing protein [Streptomyces sp. NBC_00984]
MSTTRPMLTQREAATACGVSRTTIRRRREDGDLPGAVQDPKREWLIPIDDLLAAGLRLHAPAPPDAPTTQAGPTEDDGQEHDDVMLRAELARVRQELAAERHGRQLAETEAWHLREVLTARTEHLADLQRTVHTLLPS